MFKRDELGFLSYWQFQIVGWSGLYLLGLAGIFPYLKVAGTLRANSAAFAALFVVSCLLRPICRSLVRRHSSWVALELSAFGWSLPAGAVVGLVSELSILDIHRMDWADWGVSSMQSVVVMFLWCSLYFSIKQWQQSARERERLLRAETEVREARLSALRYQLNPHFLFNSLNAVSTLVLEGNAPAATRMLAQIGELLRTSLDSEATPETPLSQEMAFTEQYLAIEQTRLGSRLRVETAISSDTLDALVPNMLLQPLVENAVRHGVSPLVEGGTIRIQSKLVDGRLQLTLQNSGRPDIRPVQQRKPANGIGISNTAERLKTLYGSDQKFALEWPDTGGCRVTVEIPFRKHIPAAEELACAR